MKTDNEINGKVEVRDYELLISWSGFNMVERFMGRKRPYANVESEVVISWDWLMPVVEKIEAMGYDTEIRCTSHTDKGERVINLSCSIETWNGHEVAQNYNLVKILAVYGAIVEFIKWYNQIEKEK